MVSLVRLAVALVALPVVLVIVSLVFTVATRVLRYYAVRKSVPDAIRAPHWAPFMLQFSDGGVDQFRDMARTGDSKPGDGKFNVATNMGIYADGSLYVVFAHPDATKAITADTDTFAKKRFVYDALAMLLGNGLVLSHGALWHRQRKLLSPLFHLRRLRSYLPIFNDEGRALCDALNTDAFAYAVPPFNDATLRVAVRSVFGAGIDAARVGHLFKTAIDDLNTDMMLQMVFPRKVLDKLLFWLPAAARFTKSRAALRATVHAVIEQRRAQLRAAAGGGGGGG
eukprot:CAMPEP_0198326830 /NCGR_PEP_ID=MMETSP1450-20131203/14246_1 /TAXON_ID=753684 ORGANISM="Madagascaria erythrocladiodes, Strain CCMP3234" /NCGR_SAMPLE_ID=MMETSP1450 /ASSEMBLY_ACC=CAM_ASM_001115 /LENGTH=281 /DNA_ID=CAMNT_0044030831 /DNA_START=155 /DNA_END=997 /DNA_ORIENTATION=-